MHRRHHYFRHTEKDNVKDKVFIASPIDHTIYEVNEEGNMVKQFGSSSEKGAGCLYCPFICAVDSEGQLLIADQGHMQFKLVTTEGISNKWSSLHVATEKACDVKVDSTGCIARCSQHSKGNYVLKKYELCM